MNILCGESSLLFEDVVNKYTKMIYQIAYTRTLNSADAEEIVQDTFLRLLSEIRKKKSFENEQHLKAWLLRVAINRGKSIISMAWNRHTQSIETIKDKCVLEEREENEAYYYVMCLPENYRVAIELFYYHGLSTEEIAKVMKVRASTIRSYLHRGREKLKKMLEANGYVG